MTEGSKQRLLDYAGEYWHSPPHDVRAVGDTLA